MTVANINVNREPPDDVHRDLARLREVTGKVVGLTFFGTLLKSMRESNLSGAYGHGGRGEQVFAAQLHGMYAERLGESVSKGHLGEILYRRLANQQKLVSKQDSVRTHQTNPTGSGRST